MKIAIFDSGAGGLTVLNRALQELNDQEIVYFADSDHVPYGEKDPSLVKKYIIDAVNFLAKQKIDALVIACNTATSLSIRQLRTGGHLHFPIFGMEPALKLAVDELKANDKKILLTGTKITIASNKVKKLIKRFSKTANIDTLALGELVNFVENENFDKKLINQYLSEKIKNPQDYDAVVLGCTHFSFFTKEFQEFFAKKTLIVDGNLGTITHLKNQLNLKANPKLKDNRVEFYFSKKTNQAQEDKYRRLLARLN